MGLSHLKNYHIYVFTLFFCSAFFSPIVYAEENITEKVAKHGATISNNIKDAAADIGTRTVNDATSTLRRIFNLFFNIPEKTVSRFKKAADRMSRESSFFAYEVQDLGSVIRQSAHNLAQNARALGQRVGKVGTNLNKTECSQLAIIFTLPSFIDPQKVNALKEQQTLTKSSSTATLELLQSTLGLLEKTVKHTDDVQLDVAWNIEDDIENIPLLKKQKNATHIIIVLNGALDLSQWDHTIDDVLRIQHYAKKNKSDFLLLDAIENLCKKATHHSLLKSVQIVQKQNTNL